MYTFIIIATISMVMLTLIKGVSMSFISLHRVANKNDEDAKQQIGANILEECYNHAGIFLASLELSFIIFFTVCVISLFWLTMSLSQLSDSAIALPLYTLVSFILIWIFAIILPRLLFGKDRDNSKYINWLILPIGLIYCLFTPLVRVVNRLVSIVIRKKESEEDAINRVFGAMGINWLMQKKDSTSEMAEEVKLFRNAIDFSSIKVRDCLIPRTEIEAIEDTASLSELKTIFTESGKSKIIVYKEDLDNVIGYIHSSELFQRNKDSHWTDNIRSIPIVPETMNAQKLMKTFMQEKKSIAIVVDEFGGTSGIVALEDLVEEIFGDIEDEHDTSNYIACQIGDGVYVLSARLEIDKANEIFNLKLPESEDYMTIGGLILQKIQRLPKVNETIKIDTYQFQILKNTSTKIELVQLKTLS